VSAAICLYELRSRMESSGIDKALDPQEKRSIYRLWLRSTLKNCEILERGFIEGFNPAG
jgi:hypothetical protein